MDIGGLTLALMLAISAITVVKGDVSCFRRYLPKKDACKGQMKRGHFRTPEKCCSKKKSAGYAMELQKVGKNKYVCIPCSDLENAKTTTTAPPLAEWASWGPCSATCGAGWRSKYRLCDDCDKNHFENVKSEPCMLNFYCPVNGNWGPWFPWQPCSSSCDGGVRLRQRRCNYPSPTHGGFDCPGANQVEDTCNEKPCPVDGEWGAWTSWSLCSETCGQGTMVSSRQCNNPAPAHEGRDCPGQRRQTRRCQNRHCPQDGGWSLWNSWSPCAVTCGDGHQKRIRSCDSPRALFGGKDCDGEDTDKKVCSAGRPCPVNGSWGTWTNYGHCRADRCGKGSQLRSRSCVNPRPRHGGRPCVGQRYERVECFNNDNCPIDGNWCEWNDWSSCTATCAGLNSMQMRQRTCSCPSVSMGGRDCEGDNFEVGNCEGIPTCEDSYSGFIRSNGGGHRKKGGCKRKHGLESDGIASGDGSDVECDQEEETSDDNSDATKNPAV